jgi:hypothetical protein
MTHSDAINLIRAIAHVMDETGIYDCTYRNREHEIDLHIIKRYPLDIPIEED